MSCDRCEVLHAEATAVRAQLNAYRRAEQNAREWLRVTAEPPGEPGVYWARERGADWRVVFVRRNPVNGLEYWDDGQPLSAHELYYYVEWSGMIPMPGE